MDQLLLGTAIQRDHKPIVVETRPGYRLAFPGGQAQIRNEIDMVHLLRREDLIITVDEWVDFVPGWMNQCGWAKPAVAQVNLPDDFRVAQDDKGVWHLRSPHGQRGRPPGIKNKPKEASDEAREIAAAPPVQSNDDLFPDDLENALS